MELKLLIENVYSGKDFTELTSDYIYDYNTYKLTNGVVEFSRYNFPTLDSTYDPYKISRKFLRNLGDRITLINNPSVILTNINDCIICFNKSSAVINELPRYLLTEPLITEYGDYTSFGLLLILFRKNYGIEEFKVKVENDLLGMNYVKSKLRGKECLVYERTSPINALYNILESDGKIPLNDIFMWKD